MIWLRRLIDRVLRFEDLRPDPTFGPYLHRWTLLALPRKRRVYLHHYVGPDWCADPHDHPKTFISIGLLGGYIENVFARPEGYVQDDATWNGVQLRQVARRFWRAPWIRRFPAGHIHVIELFPYEHERGAWTICITTAEERDWGFFLRHGPWVEWQSYLRHFAHLRRAQPRRSADA